MRAHIDSKRVKDLIRQELRDLFDYRDGELYWKTRPANHFINQKGCNIFNGRNAGKKAGSLSKTNHQKEITINFNGIKSAHKSSRLIWLWHNGEFPPRRLLHKDGDKDNNRIENLFLSKKSI